MIRLKTSEGTVTLTQRTGKIRLTQPAGLVTFKQKQGEPVTPPVYQLDFTKDYNSQYINIIF